MISLIKVTLMSLIIIFFIQGSPSCKKIRTEVPVELPEDNCLLSALKSLTPEQLIGVIGQIVIDHPNIEKVNNYYLVEFKCCCVLIRDLFNSQEIRSKFPIADLKPLEERIYYLRRNIYKALPSNRLISKTDPIAYSRVSTHVLAFKVSFPPKSYSLLEVIMYLTYFVSLEMCCRPRQTFS